jgi:hypothetical protein
LPRIFRQRIEESVNTKAEPIEESLINELLKIIQDAQAEISTRFRLNLNIRDDPQTTTAEPTPKEHNDTVNQQLRTTLSAAELSDRNCQTPPQRGGNVGSVDVPQLAFNSTFHQTSNADSSYTTLEYKLDRCIEPFQASTLSIASTDEGPGASLTNRREMATEGNVETREIQDKPSLMNNEMNERIIDPSKFIER